MADTSKAGMTIKGVPIQTRQTMVSIAQQRQLSMADLLVEMVDALRANHAGNRIEMPAMPNKPNAGMVVSPPGKLVAPLDLGELRDTMLALKAMSDAAGMPVPKHIANHAYAVLRDRLREARGMPAVKPRQTSLLIGET